MEYSAYYTLQQLNADLFFVRWYRRPVPDSKSETEYVAELRDQLNAVNHSLYFLSNLRRGRIVNVRILNELAELTHHPHYGGGVAFSDDNVSNMFVNIFSRLTDSEENRHVFHPSIEAAVAHLETLKPGISAGLDITALT